MNKKNKSVWISYKFLVGNKSARGDHTWKLNKWYSVDGDIELCKNGFHASKKPLDAFGYVRGDIVALVEARGEAFHDSDKSVFSEMRIVKKAAWTKEDSVQLAVYSASLVLHLFENKYPDDKRPRNAINAAKRRLKDKSADAAAYAYDAADAAYDAAWAAYAYDAAAYAAAKAAYAAAKAAYAAAKAADAAYAAAWAAYAACVSRVVKQKINTWMIRHINKKFREKSK